MKQRRLKSKGAKKAFWKLTLLIGALLIVVAGVGTYYYDQGVQKQKIAYEKQVDEARNAKDKAYDSRKANDIEQAHKLIDKLHVKDKTSLDKSMSQLTNYLSISDK